MEMEAFGAADSGLLNFHHSSSAAALILRDGHTQLADAAIVTQASCALGPSLIRD
jgi:hypothetical protein